MNVPPQFSRTAILIQPTGVHFLANQHVFLAGLGGVGGFCAEALARAGIGKLTLVDHDTVSVSNINRQLPALLSTLGQFKAELIKERIFEINPHCEVEIITEFLTVDNLEQFLPESCDYIIDAIDSLNSKVALIAKSYQRGFKVASSMGAGNRLDPTRIKLADISKTEVCPLARVVRQRLRRLNIHKGILTVYSDEEGRAPLPPEPVGEGRPRAVNGTISYMPGLFGLTLAGGVIHHLLKAAHL